MVETPARVSYATNWREIMKFIATATRRNINGKPDYAWVYTYTNNTPVLFDTEQKALDCAKAKCDDPAHGLYAPKAIPADQHN